MRQYKRGLIVGKFCPLHKGHEFLIAQAERQCEQLYILSYTNPEFPGCGPETRQKWLNLAAPNAAILVLDASHNIPPNDASDKQQRAFTAQIVGDKFGMIPDVVFSSEGYGDGFARHLSGVFKIPVDHICVDLERAAVPISGTEIRNDVHSYREYLSPNVYAHFVESVCFLGAESTGKSSLSKILASTYSTRFVKEYGRTLWIEKDGKLTFEDYMKIAATHTVAEDASKLEANHYVFIDTSPLTTLFYALEQFGFADKKLVDMSHRSYNHIFLCHPDFPMVQDGWRSDEDFRRRQHQWYVDILKERGVDYSDLTGSLDDKIEIVRFHLSQAATLKVR